MAQYLPERAIDNDFSSDSFDIDLDGIYKTIEYRRKDGTLYMRSILTNQIGTRQYQNITLSFFDADGFTHLYDINWTLSYDINGTLISRRKV